MNLPDFLAPAPAFDLSKHQGEVRSNPADYSYALFCTCGHRETIKAGVTVVNAAMLRMAFGEHLERVAGFERLHAKWGGNASNGPVAVGS